MSYKAPLPTTTVPSLHHTHTTSHTHSPHMTGPGAFCVAALLGFFLASSAVTKVGKVRKRAVEDNYKVLVSFSLNHLDCKKWCPFQEGGQRDWKQV